MKKRSYVYATVLIGTSIYCAVIQAQSAAQTHHPETFLESIRGKPDEGEQIVNHICVTCHATKPLVNLGAPRIGVRNDWLPRLNQGLELLFQHTAEGYRAMPARGGCFECDDTQLHKAIMAMLPREKSLKKTKKSK